MICFAGVNDIKRKFCAAFSAVICAVLLAGCSLLEQKTDPANVYLPADPVVTPSSSSTTSSGVRGEYSYNPTSRPSSNDTASSSTQRPTVTPSEDTEPTEFIDNYRGKWYYNHISARQKQVYRRLYESAKNNIAEFDVSDIIVNKNDIFAAFWAFDYENPQFLPLGSGYEITFLNAELSNYVKSVKILYGRTDVPQTEFESRAEAVLEEARAQSSDYEKLKYVHDWIVDNTVYSKTGALYESEADGPVVYGQALCEGYSKAFMYFAQSLGFPCICSVGTANLEEHMWNMVKIGGKWYNVDVTWDDPKSADGEQTLRHDYFLINDAQIRLDHRVEHPLMLPDAPDGYFPYGYDQDGDTRAAENNSDEQQSN